MLITVHSQLIGDVSMRLVACSVPCEGISGLRALLEQVVCSGLVFVSYSFLSFPVDVVSSVTTIAT